MNISVVGAGPVGVFSAWKLAKKHEVTLIEEHDQIGAPVQCTGILTDDILKHMPKKDLLSVTQTIVKKTVIHSPSEEVELAIQPNYIIDNIAYCRMLAAKAEDAGAKIMLNTRYVNNQVYKTKTAEHHVPTPDILLGVDGPNSQVAKENGIFGKRSFLTGVQAVVKVKDYDERIHFYPHIGEYAWYCPEGNGRARIGVAAQQKARAVFDSFISNFPGKIECMQGGPIPLYKPRPSVVRTQSDNHDTSDHRALRSVKLVQLMGDSVPQIKNTTGGGIIPGTKAASIHAQDPQSYAKNLGSLNRELYTHYLINKAMRKFSSKDWDALIRQAQDEKVKRVLGAINRDNALTMAAHLIIKKPSLMTWARKLI